MPRDDGQDVADARRGFLGTLEGGAVQGPRKRPARDMRPCAFLDAGTAPDSVNPGPWRQARLNAIHGLFEVVPGVCQVRGPDLANMTLVEGETGVILIDTLTSLETAEAVVDPADVASGKAPVIAPDRFLEEAVSENVAVGTAMLRRGHVQLGHVLRPGPPGRVDNGPGKATPMGAWALLAPNDLVRETGETRTIDGVRFEFQMAPDTGAPAEMHIWAPDLEVLNMAENACRNFHNLLPLRGAQVRNTLDWSGHINEAPAMWGDAAEGWSAGAAGPTGAMRGCASTWRSGATSAGSCMTRRCG
ncbi:hypothetical protein ACQ5SO_04990 [Rhodovulum sp. DZ06]|uniref:hypothetical protein n=1 Tax=Rhodovulum sp. DZ06 TaxID=3425126 RepID=UPI003D331207